MHAFVLFTLTKIKMKLQSNFPKLDKHRILAILLLNRSRDSLLQLVSFHKTEIIYNLEKYSKSYLL